jgi:hypothetical protein
MYPSQIVSLLLGGNSTTATASTTPPETSTPIRCRSASPTQSNSNLENQCCHHPTSQSNSDVITHTHTSEHALHTSSSHAIDCDEPFDSSDSSGNEDSSWSSVDEDHSDYESEQSFIKTKSQGDVSQNQAEMRKKIVEIQTNPNLTAAEKSKKVQVRA